MLVRHNHTKACRCTYSRHIWQFRIFKFTILSCQTTILSRHIIQNSFANQRLPLLELISMTCYRNMMFLEVTRIAQQSSLSHFFSGVAIVLYNFCLFVRARHTTLLSFMCEHESICQPCQKLILASVSTLSYGDSVVNFCTLMGVLILITLHLLSFLNTSVKTCWFYDPFLVDVAYIYNVLSSCKTKMRQIWCKV